MEDLYGSKDDDVDEDTKYIAQSLIASPLAEFYGLDVPIVSNNNENNGSKKGVNKKSNHYILFFR